MAFGVFQFLIAALLFVNICHAQEWVGSKIVNGNCYLFIDELKGWNDAMISCVNMGGTLATVTSLDQWNSIKNDFNIGDVTVWIGATKKSNGVTFLWTDSNRPATELSNLWATDYPLNQIKIDCVYLNSGAFNAPCSNTRRYLCMELNSGTSKCIVPTTTTAATTTDMLTIVADTTLAETTAEATTQPPQSTPTTMRPRKHCRKG